MRMVSPRFTSVPGDGYISSTTERVSSEELARSVNLSPAAANSVLASSTGTPTKSGTCTVWLPADTVSTTVVPGGTRVPGAGSCASTPPSGTPGETSAPPIMPSSDALDSDSTAVFDSKPVRSGTATRRDRYTNTPATTAPMTRVATTAPAMRAVLGTSERRVRVVLSVTVRSIASALPSSPHGLASRAYQRTSHGACRSALATVSCMLVPRTGGWSERARIRLSVPIV